MVGCPICATEVQADWDWCHACGWDPDGLRPDAVAPPAAPANGGRPARRRATSPIPKARAAAPRGVFAVRGRSSLTSRYRVRRPSMLRTLGVLLLVLVGGWAGLVLFLVLVVGVLGTPAEQSQFAVVDGGIEAEAPPGPTGDGAGPVRGGVPVQPGSGEVFDANGLPVDQGWTRFTAVDGSFSIDFPVEPTVEALPRQGKGVERVELTSAVVGDTEYSVTVAVLEPGFDAGEPPTVLANYVEGLFGANGMTLVTSEPGNFAYSTSHRFTASYGPSGEVLDGVVFLAGGRLYTVMVVAPEGGTLDSPRFLDSLTLG